MNSPVIQKKGFEWHAKKGKMTVKIATLYLLENWQIYISRNTALSDMNSLMP